jgi:2-aminoadipate transaminase
MKYGLMPDIISFAAGNPAPEAFPCDTIADIAARIFKEQPVMALQYLVSEGYPPLRNHLKDTKPMFDKEKDDLIVTTGSQQVMEITAKLLVNEGDHVIVESPTFTGSLNSFRSFGANLVGVPIDNHGFIPEKLEAAVKVYNPKFIYVIPNFQNPTGYCTSLERRRMILDIAERYNVIVLEDDPYGELRWSGADIPSIKEIAKNEKRNAKVIYAGSFSKVIAPALRVGFMCADSEIVVRAIAALQAETVHTTSLSQMIVHRFLTEVDMPKHFEKLQNLYQHKSKLMLDNLRMKMPLSVDFNEPAGGMFLWATITNPDPDRDEVVYYCKKVIENKVLIVQGSAFLTDEAQIRPSFRLNFSTPTDEQIVEGVDRMAQVAKTMWK